MDITNHIQSSTNAWPKQIPKQNHFNFKIMSVISIIIVLTITLISGSILSSNVFAAKNSPRDICKINIEKCNCSNVIESLSAYCCTRDTEGKAHCETCDIDVKTGNYVNCTTIPIKSSNQANLPDNVTVGGTYEPKKDNLGKSANLNTTNDAVGTFSNSGDN